MKGLSVVIGLCLTLRTYFLFRGLVLHEGLPLVGRVPVILLLLTAQVVAMAVAFASEYRLPKGFDLTNDGPA